MKTMEKKLLQPGTANLEKFSATLQDLAAGDPDIVVVCSDSRGSGKLVPFGKQFPDQLVEVGIAEQNLVGIAAGLASCGKKTFAVSPACFLTARSFEQIKNDVAYSDNPVNLVGISAGVSYGALGSTHHSLHDFAALRAVNNMTIVAPADNFETEMAIRQSAALNSPVYLRFGKKAMPFLNENRDFDLGKGRLIKAGKEAMILATGETVYPALLAAIRLESHYKLQVGVISMHTIKPLDTELLAEVGDNYKAVLTVEEHSIYGGLGEACAAFFMEEGYSLKFKILGIPDEYTVTGAQGEIFEHYGISESGITATIVKLLQ